MPGKICFLVSQVSRLITFMKIPSVILGFSNSFACITGMVSPILTGVLVQNQVGLYHLSF